MTRNIIIQVHAQSSQNENRLAIKIDEPYQLYDLFESKSEETTVRKEFLSKLNAETPKRTMDQRSPEEERLKREKDTRTAIKTNKTSYPGQTHQSTGDRFQVGTPRREYSTSRNRTTAEPSKSKTPNRETIGLQRNGK